MMSQRLHEFLRFCVVGFIGFVVDASVLELLVWLGLSAPQARIFSILVALQCSYLLHATFTFRGKAKTSRAWLKFMIANLTGAGINYLTFLAIFTYSPIENPLLHRQTALVGGMSLALFFNYWANQRFVFRAGKP